MENPFLVMAISLLVVLALLSTGIWISAGIGIIGIIMLAFIGGTQKVSMVGMIQFNALNSFIFTAVPLFVFMGEMVLHSGLGDRLYQGLTNWVGWLPGGLLHTNIATCAFFASVSGSSMATAATIGTVAFPEMEKRGYGRRLILGSLAAGGTLGILIPPSIIMIVYGAFVGESVGRLFMAGVFPGLLLAGLFMIYIAVRCTINPGLAPERVKTSPKMIFFAIKEILPVAVISLLVLGSIYTGFATPTEAAALGVMISVVMCALSKRLTWTVLKEASLSAVEITSWAMLIVIGASALAMGFSFMKVPANLASYVGSLALSRGYIFIAVVLLYIVLGCFIEALGMMLLTLPVVHPIMMSLGFDSVWFGIMIVIFVEMGQITPPVGVNLFVIHGISGRKDIRDVIFGAAPFFLIMIIIVVILYFLPDLALWLPDRMIKSF